MSTEKYEPKKLEEGTTTQEKANIFVKLMRDTREEFSGGGSRFRGPTGGSPFIVMLNHLDHLDGPTKEVLQQDPEVLEIINDFENRFAGPLPEYGRRIRGALNL